MTLPVVRLLLVEDDGRLAELVAEYLAPHGFVVSIEPNGERAVERIVSERPDVVLLDVMLPGRDGLAVCRDVRSRYDGAIVMLTARAEEVDEVVGLEIGADDYVAKPVRPRVLLARIRALLRRREAQPTVAVESKLIHVGALIVDIVKRSAMLREQHIELTTAEFDLLVLLATHAGQVVTRESIFAQLRGAEFDGLDRSIDLRVSRLRRKLGDDSRRPRRLKSIRGTGYVLVAEP